MELLVARPRVVMRLHTNSNFCWVGKPLHDLFPRVCPGVRRLCEPETHPGAWGCGTSLLRSRPSSLLRYLSEHVYGVSCVVGVGAAPLTTSYTVLQLDES